MLLCILPCIHAAAVISCINPAEYADKVTGLHVDYGQACYKQLHNKQYMAESRCCCACPAILLVLLVPLVQRCLVCLLSVLLSKMALTLDGHASA